MRIQLLLPVLGFCFFTACGDLGQATVSSTEVNVDGSSSELAGGRRPVIPYYGFAGNPPRGTDGRIQIDQLASILSPAQPDQHALAHLGSSYMIPYNFYIGPHNGNYNGAVISPRDRQDLGLFLKAYPQIKVTAGMLGFNMGRSIPVEDGGTPIALHDYVGWASNFNKLAKSKPSLVGINLDDFMATDDQGNGHLKKGYLTQECAAANANGVSLKMYPTVYCTADWVPKFITFMNAFSKTDPVAGGCVGGVHLYRTQMHDGEETVMQACVNLLKAKLPKLQVIEGIYLGDLAEEQSRDQDPAHPEYGIRFDVRLDHLRIASKTRPDAFMMYMLPLTGGAVDMSDDDIYRLRRAVYNFFPGSPGSFFTNPF